MKTAAAAIVLAALSILLVGAGIGCGGSGDDPLPTATPLTPTQLYSGAYHYTAFWGNYTGPSAATWWGDYTADGAGMITGGTLSVNNNGAPIATAPVVPFPYTVDANHRVVWSPGVPAEHTGGLATDGRAVVVASSHAPGTPFPTLALSLRRAGTFTAGSLVGTYHVAAIWRAGATVASIWGTVNFDGVNMVTWTVDSNFNGVITSPAAFAPGAYSVAGDGTVEIHLGTATLRGGMLDGGEFVMAAGTDSPASPQLMMVLIRQATTASAATLTGPYHLAFLHLDFGGAPHYTSLTGPMTADGAGMLTIPMGALSNVDGAVTPTLADSSGPYAILPNGLFTISNLQGAIAQSGAFAFLGGRTTNLSDPELWIMIR